MQRKDGMGEVIVMVKREWPLYVFFLFSGIFLYAAAVLAKNVSMIYLWLLVPSVACGLLGYLCYRRHHRYKQLRKLRQAWGKEQTAKERQFEKIAFLFKSMPHAQTDIDDRTWYDLNMDTVFSKIDRTFAWPGQMRLYQILRTPVISDLAMLEQRKGFIKTFQESREQREAIQLELSIMDGRTGSGLATLLWDRPAITPIHSLNLYRFMYGLALMSPLLIILGSRYFFPVLLVFQANMYLHFSAQKEIKSYFEGVRSLGQLIRVGKGLGVVQSPELEPLLRRVRAAVRQVQGYSKIVRHVGVESNDPLMGVFLQYFSIFFLAEVRGFFRALAFIEKNRAQLQQLFLVIGELDALQAVASYRTSLSYYAEPTFTQQRQFEITEAYHALLQDPVSNSILVTDEEGILVTGSNMSGKSTFLRTVGLNALFAQTIVTCLAREYVGCPVQLITNIGRADNVVEGKSYYLDEALGVRRVLDALNGEIVTMAIFDELFRGTNSEERIFAAWRVLQYLVSRNSLVFVATHDLELTELLARSYTSVHFSERVGDLGLEFDYKLKKGPATTKNAIALLRYLEYPKEITDPELESN